MAEISKKSDSEFTETVPEKVDTDSEMESTPEKGTLDSTAVLDYLKENPDFFVDNPGILDRLKIPHPCGDNTISLIERQVLVLREQMHQQRQQFNELVENARSNETLNQQLHKLTLQLIGCTSLHEVFPILYDRLTADFMADAVQVRIFLAPRCTADAKLKELSDWGGVVPEVIKPLIDTGGEPICVQIRVAQMTCLFGEQAADFGSGMFMPLKGENERIFGLLGIGSRDPKRFQHTMGTIFMSQLGEIVGRVISPYISDTQEPDTQEESDIQEND
uniref:DUF484 family protein n=1 Tax=Candidatus Kentrum sp. FW TaxID=2126338 RepID=A0A450SIE2_9GAMM|nr:MAG: hypothetical protein BECKFW1821A_GA0114235_10406 [Candidatus Kentron sp. FW]